MFRRKAVSQITNKIGCYVLCDLDSTPIYVGKSVDGIRSRVNRHLTSARSDIIANRQVDVWEIAWVWTFPATREEIEPLEAALFAFYNAKRTLMNGSTPRSANSFSDIPEPFQKIQVMHSSEISEKLDATLRLPRQAEHYSSVIGHFLAVKNSRQIARSIDAHFERLAAYHKRLLGMADEKKDDAEGLS